MLLLHSGILAEALSMIVLDKTELIVSRKAGCWTIVCKRLLTLIFLSAAIFINIYNALMLFERFSREEVATAQLLCASDKYITLPLFTQSLVIYIYFLYICLKFLSYNCKLQIY